MPYKILGHTADIRLSAEGKDLEELFKDALLGMMEILRNDAKQQMGKEAAAREKISLNSSNADILLIDFLSEVLTKAQISKQLYKASDVKIKTSDKETRLDAEISGYPIEGFDKDVKAVTYHDAKIIKNEKGNFQITITFDI